MNKKEEIMQNALKLFAEEGYEHIGVQRIVEEVGVTKPTLYHYYGNKEGLLDDIMTTYTKAFYQQLEKASNYQQDIQKTMVDVIRLYIDYAKKAPIFFRLQNHLRKAPLKSPSRQIVQDYLTVERSLLLNLFYQISQHHTGLKNKEAFFTTAFLGLVISFIEIHIDDESLDQMSDEAYHQLSKQFLYGIFSL